MEPPAVPANYSTVPISKLGDQNNLPQAAEVDLDAFFEATTPGLDLGNTDSADTAEDWFKADQAAAAAIEILVDDSVQEDAETQFQKHRSIALEKFELDPEAPPPPPPKIYVTRQEYMRRLRKGQIPLAPTERKRAGSVHARRLGMSKADILARVKRERAASIGRAAGRSQGGRGSVRSRGGGSVRSRGGRGGAGGAGGSMRTAGSRGSRSSATRSSRSSQGSGAPTPMRPPSNSSDVRRGPRGPTAVPAVPDAEDPPAPAPAPRKLGVSRSELLARRQEALKAERAAAAAEAKAKAEARARMEAEAAAAGTAGESEYDDSADVAAAATEAPPPPPSDPYEGQPAPSDEALNAALPPGTISMFGGTPLEGNNGGLQDDAEGDEDDAPPPPPPPPSGGGGDDDDDGDNADGGDESFAPSAPSAPTGEQVGRAPIKKSVLPTELSSILDSPPPVKPATSAETPPRPRQEHKGGCVLM